MFTWEDRIVLKSCNTIQGIFFKRSLQNVLGNEVFMVRQQLNAVLA